MDLKIKDVADLLKVSEKTIRKWISDRKIPNYRMNQHYYFSRSEIENWIISHKFDKTEEKVFLSSSPFSQSVGGSKQFSLFRAIHKGDVFYKLKGKTKEEIIRAAMKKVAPLIDVDAEVMIDLLLDRENLMPTALNNGIAVPHTRDTLLSTHYDVVIPVFLQEPLDYGALDGKPVHTLFFLFACEDKRHLDLLAKIAHLSSQSDALTFFQTKPTKEDLLGFIKEWESRMPVAKQPD